MAGKRSESRATDGSLESWKAIAAREGSGKSGGARVIYYNRLDNGEIWLLTLHAKSDRSTIPAHELKMIKKEVIDRD